MDSAKISRRILLFWCFFIGIGAVWGSLCMFIDPSGKTFGMDSFFVGFEKLPFYEVLFQNLIFPGISLFIVNGISNLTAAVLILKKKKIGITLGMLFGFTLMLWICIQFMIFPANPLSISYFIFGVLQLITGYVCFVRTRQDGTVLNAKDYPNIQKRSKTLVVYFSRKGYTKKLAYQVANEQKAELLELKSKERTEGTLGFWWCGRFGMHGWSMPIEEVNVAIEQYEKVIICTPVWVFSIAAPMKSFLMQMSGKIHNVEYIINHFNPVSYPLVAKKMDEMLNIHARKVTSVTTQVGTIQRRKVIEG